MRPAPQTNARGPHVRRHNAGAHARGQGVVNIPYAPPSLLGTPIVDPTTFPHAKLALCRASGLSEVNSVRGRPTSLDTTRHGHITAGKKGRAVQVLFGAYSGRFERKTWPAWGVAVLLFASVLCFVAFTFVFVYVFVFVSVCSCGRAWGCGRSGCRCRCACGYVVVSCGVVWRPRPEKSTVRRQRRRRLCGVV